MTSKSTSDEAEATYITNRILWCKGAQLLGVVCIIISAVLVPWLRLGSAICLGFGFLLMAAPLFLMASLSNVKRSPPRVVPNDAANSMVGAITLAGVACLVASFIAGIMTLLSMSTVFPVPSNGFMFIALSGGIGMVLMSASIALRMRQRARSALDVRDRNFLICPHCRYDLRHLPDQGACPECGEPYSYDELPQLWKKEMGAW